MASTMLALRLPLASRRLVLPSLWPTSRWCSNVRTTTLATVLASGFVCASVAWPIHCNAAKIGETVLDLGPGESRLLRKHSYYRFKIGGFTFRHCVRMRYEDTGKWGKKMCTKHADSHVIERLPGKLATPELTNESDHHDEGYWEGRY
jgi:hypothetical protein